MEADVEPSKETEERLRAEEEARHKKEREREAQLAAREAFERAEQDRIQLEDKQRMEASQDWNVAFKIAWHSAFASKDYTRLFEASRLVLSWRWK